MPPSRPTANAGSSTVSVGSPTATAAAAAVVRPPQFKPGATSRQLKQSNSMIFMMRAIYHYLSQFGFEDLAASVRTALGTRFHPNPDSAEIVLDDINTLLIAAHMPRTVGSSVFRLECEVRIAAVMCVIDQPAQLYQEVIEQFYTEELICTQEQADRIDKKIAAGQTCTDIELRKHHLFYQRLHLIDYRKEKTAVQKLDKKSPTRRHAEQEVAKFESEHSRYLLQESVTVFLQEILARTKVSGAVFLEHLGTYLMKNKDVYIGPEGREDEPRSESEAEEEDEEEEEEAAVEEEDEDEEMAAAEESPQPFVAQAQKRTLRSVKDESEMEDGTPSAAAASPNVVSTPSVRSAKPSAFPAAAVASSASVAASPAPARRGRPPGSSSSVAAASPARAAPKEVLALQSASKLLKAEGRDPLAESLRSTQALSKKRRSREESKEETPEEEEEEEDPNVELEEEDEPAPAPVKTRGPIQRPRKAAKYDREQEDAEKVEADQEMQYRAATDDEEEDEEDAVSLPKFKGKRPTGAVNAGKTPAQLAPATSDPSQRSRPVVHRHAQDRSAKRVPWSSSEIQKLTDGVIEYASERKKWSLILSKYNEFFQDRTVVDLKDKWRNLKGKVGGKAKKGSKVDNAIDEGMEEIED